MALDVFKFKGKTLGELNEMSVKEFAELCTSRIRRSLSRARMDGKFFKKVEKEYKIKAEGGKPKIIRTHKRNAIITPHMMGLMISIYNGKEFVVVNITEEMIGNYLGEYALTRKRIKHGKAGIGATKSSTAIASRK